ncbi:hypothetical protein SZ51_06980 [Brachyspira hyodysenteriae]|uniref:hypothetical protein n=1 Tax=Brachyspira hyodysenteriae TaxID=159 RepID=UPI00063DB0F7|nr:hypothetical protein [Brachyspira hyodysenteriae]KLI38475.1 hypothetical protein SZ51_06980 [Brachyspira hyodysenteriae]
MPLPVIAIVGIAVGGALALLGVGGVVFYQVDKNAPADLTILLIGEKEAGKDTVFRVLKGDGFVNTYNVALNYEPIMAKVNKKKIKIINTTGSESSWKDTEKAKGLPHDIRCYVFDSRKFYSDNVIKLGIKDSINDCGERNITLLTIGTRGDEVNNKKDIENEVKSFGSNCKIFELSKNPREDLMKYIFKI